MNLGGGTHHAGRDFARGYCLFNDVAVATAALRRDGLADRVLVVDCDVHQGDGTADIFAEDPRTFTLSLHGARNYPFSARRVRPRRRHRVRHGRRALPARADRGARLRAGARAARLLRSTSPGPIRGRATGSAGSRSASRACWRATSWRSTGCWTRARRSASCWPAATPTTCATPSTSTPRRLRPWPRRVHAPDPGKLTIRRATPFRPPPKRLPW